MELLSKIEAREELKKNPNKEVFVRVEVNPKFAVSNLGMVVNTWNGKQKKMQVKRQTGDVVVTLDSLTYRVSHLVATAFIENEKQSRFVMHKDMDKQNNSYTNLYWSSSARRKNDL